jgi:hypothetical protein
MGLRHRLTGTPPEGRFLRRCPLLRAALLACVLLLSGCATIMHGSHQVVPVTSSPAGARVLVDGEAVGTAPVQLTLRRDRDAVVSVVDDSLGALETVLARRLSPWVLGSAALNLMPALVDVATGSTHRFERDTLAVAFPGFAPVPPASVRDWGLAAGDRVRWLQRGRDAVVEAQVDSAAAGRLYVRLLEGSPSSPAQGAVQVAVDAPRLAVHRAADRGQGGVSGAHYAALGAFVPLMVLAGASDGIETGLVAGLFWSIVAAPVGFLAGAAAAQPRWAPFEAHRTGSPLLANDRVRVVATADAGRQVAARLVDIDGADLVLAVRGDTLRFERSAITSLERADGRDLSRGALYGASAGSLVAVFSCSQRSRCAGSEAVITAAAGAGLGLVLAPAFAPRRWTAVSRW